MTNEERVRTLKNGNRCTEELLITEFSEEFFEKQINDESEKKYIQELQEKVHELKEKTGKGTWHCIFDVVMEEIDFAIDSDVSGLTKIIYEFHFNGFFLSLDVAQKIAYNLERLGERQIYDMDKGADQTFWENKKLTNLLSIGRKSYKGEKSVGKNLIPDLSRINEKYERIVEQPKVIFPKITDGNKIILERDFLELNVLFIGNEKFQNYLYHNNYIGTKTYEILMEQIKQLDSMVARKMQYIWEKMTNFNTINIETKFVMNILEKRGKIGEKEAKEYARYVVERHKYLFKVINRMPNVLTKLLILKEVFDCISGAYKDNKIVDSDIDEILDEVDEALNKIFITYSDLQEKVFQLAVKIRWGLNGVKERKWWMRELENEYPMELFEALYLSANLDDSLINAKQTYVVDKKYTKIEKYHLLFMYINEGRLFIKSGSKLTDISKEHLMNLFRAVDAFSFIRENENFSFVDQEFIKKNNYVYLCTYWDHVLENRVRKCKLLDIIGKENYTSCASKLAKKLYTEGWVSIDALYKGINQQEDGYEYIPGGIVCTQKSTDKVSVKHAVGSSEKKELKIKPIKYDDKCKSLDYVKEEEHLRYIKKAVKPMLLSPYRKVILENNETNNPYRYEDIFNVLLYEIEKN